MLPTPNKHQLITPLMTDEEAAHIVRTRTRLIEGLGFFAIMLVCIVAWVALPA